MFYPHVWIGRFGRNLNLPLPRYQNKKGDHSQRLGRPQTVGEHDRARLHCNVYVICEGHIESTQFEIKIKIKKGCFTTYTDSSMEVT